ncbi:type II toxin-antitoxin system ParD family antitoxin [Litorimonas sp.]|uniref:type II toxin-antitoxin system ParD family antitoxin n=1 Tax=Litorimonas sp. TaxID=1892381 RepID=UPI003A88510E
MAHNTSISLGDHFSSFIGTQIGAGRYNSASDVIRAGLRLLEEHEAKVQALQEALIAGEKSGKAAPFDFDKFIEKKHGEFNAK